MGIRGRGRVLVCKNRRDKCPARYRPWPIEDFKKSFVGVVSEIDQKEFCIEMKEIELEAAEYELGLWQEKRSRKNQQIERLETVSVGGQGFREDREIEQLQQLIRQLQAELCELKEEKAQRRSVEYVTAGDVDPLSLDRVNAARIDQLVNDIFLAPLGTEPGIEERRQIAKTAKANFDVVHAVDELRGVRFFRIRLKDGEEVMCFPNKDQPAVVQCQYSYGDPDQDQKHGSYKGHLICAVPFEGNGPWNFEIIAMRPKEKEPSEGSYPCK